MNVTFPSTYETIRTKRMELPILVLSDYTIADVYALYGYATDRLKYDPKLSVEEQRILSKVVIVSHNRMKLYINDLKIIA